LVAQFVGGIVGALVLWGIVSGSPQYSRSGVGLGADGWGHKASMTGLGAGSAFATDVVLTSTRPEASAPR
jgi:aquaporin Z